MGRLTSHKSLRDFQLVDRAANLIKPVGLFFSLSVALIACALIRVGHRWRGLLALVAIIGHIGNLRVVAVPVNVVLVVAFGSLVWARSDGQQNLRTNGSDDGS